MWIISRNEGHTLKNLSTSGSRSLTAFIRDSSSYVNLGSAYLFQEKSTLFGGSWCGYSVILQLELQVFDHGDRRQQYPGQWNNGKCTLAMSSSLPEVPPYWMLLIDPFRKTITFCVKVPVLSLNTYFIWPNSSFSAVLLGIKVIMNLRIKPIRLISFKFNI